MFKKARVKLTAWYLLIIMTISISFSAFIYGTVTMEFQRRFDNIERRLEFEELGLRPPVGDPSYFLQDLQESRKNVFFILLYTNGVILVLSTLAGYILAGKTLSPIEAALDEQKRFVADASHELKTPLTALQTTIEVSLRDKKLNIKDAKEILKSNLEETQRLSKLATDLLTLTRYQSGNGNFTLSKSNIKNIVKDVYKSLLPVINKKDIKVKLTLDDISLNINKDSIYQLVTILLDNAIKFSNKGKGVIYVSVGKEHNLLVLKVKDNGIGIPKKDIPYIFDRFYRVDQSRSKHEIDGFGLGLSMAKRIVELHKGTINVESTLGKGSTFKVNIPLNL